MRKIYFIILVALSMSLAGCLKPGVVNDDASKNQPQLSDPGMEQANNNQKENRSREATTMENKSEVAAANNLQTYQDDKLGIAFEYPGEWYGVKMLVKKNNNSIYLYQDGQDYKQGQYLIVFKKNINDSLKEAIKKTILQGYPKEDCFVGDFDMRANYQYTDNYVLIDAINYPRNEKADSMEDILKNNCPYSATNGVRYFLADKNNYDKFIFLSIGQHEIEVEDGLSWQETIKFISD